ncbi:SUKH-3 domain-containing protein [Streptomyces sp. NPDC092952]|uniref:SUKH-3 domain-containing protein n=1 Tax=Streptomyces sp. NPDC092952 TaxID=3366018 RepID=UPI00380462F4
MNHDRLTPEVCAWLTTCQWSADRDIGARTEEWVRIRVLDAEEHGIVLTPPPEAVRIMRHYGELRIAHPTDPESAWIMDPTFGYRGDATAIAELAAELGTELFPIGYEALEYGILLADRSGRVFQLHHTGGYYMGASMADALARFLDRTAPLDAEDSFVRVPDPGATDRSDTAGSPVPDTGEATTETTDAFRSTDTRHT